MNSELGIRNCHCEPKARQSFKSVILEGRSPDRIRLSRRLTLVFSLSSLVFLSACTDYVAQIDERYGEWETSAQFSSSETSVSSSSEKSSSVAPSTVVEGMLTDSRDGKTYKTVTIGTQTWMAENLNYAYIGIPYNNSGYTSDSTSWCYGDNPANCTKYGRLYTWAAAMDSVGTLSTNGKGCGYGTICSPTYPVRGICPEGWHLPTEEEFETLFTAVGGKSTAGRMLKSTSGWNSSGNGTDAYAFSALSAGFRHFNGYFNYEGNNAYFWSSTEDDSGYAYYMYLYYGNGSAGLSNYLKYYGFSVRCLKDEGEAVESSSSSTPKSSSSETSVSSSSVKSSSSAMSSSSEKAESSSSKTPEPEGGVLTDSRDGQTYKTVSIGTQTWMAENLNYETTNSYCYSDNVSNCTKYGRLYTWSAAIDSVGTWSANGKGCGLGKTCSPTYPVRGVCPEGWHLPTQTEWNTLFTAVGGQSTAGKMLKSTSGWNSSGNGTDAYSFSALPAGYRNDNGRYYYEGNVAYFWSSPESYSNDAYDMYLSYDDGLAYLFSSDLKNYGFSVRCLKD